VQSIRPLQVYNTFIVPNTQIYKKRVPQLAEMSTDNKLDTKEHDVTLIEVFIADLGLDIEYKSNFRLGKKNYTEENPKRPFKVVMNSEQDKDLIMANLEQLKGKEKHKGVRVMDDHSIKDRNIIRIALIMPKLQMRKNLRIHNMSGKSGDRQKNGMYLKKFRKRNPVA